MAKRFVTIWFRYLQTDWWSIHNPFLKSQPFALTVPDHGKILIAEANAVANQKGIFPGMPVADARVIDPALKTSNNKPGHSEKLLKGLAEWCIRYTPIVTIDPPDGIILDASGCSHLWDGEYNYVNDIVSKLKGLGYTVNAAIADTIGSAWAVTRFEKNKMIVSPGEQMNALLYLPPAALRIEISIAERLQKLGLRQIGDFIRMPRSVLLRRFGQDLIESIDYALGNKDEIIVPIVFAESFQERLPSLEPIISLTGIEIATEQLLKKLCDRLIAEQKGLRNAILKCYRVDGKIEIIEISTNHASNNSMHLFKLFELKFQNIEPALGIEFFLLEAKNVEKLVSAQEKLWGQASGLKNVKVAELLDRVAGRVGENQIHRYLPDEHYWPERSYKKAASIHEKAATPWKISQPRPVQLMKNPQPIAVTAPVPDYPPMLFRYKGNIHKIIKADGPERIEQEWWLQDGSHRDYYIVEDEKGNRYWIFRLGHYGENNSHQWFLHGFFA